jgi:hypothetical protein
MQCFLQKYNQGEKPNLNFPAAIGYIQVMEKHWMAEYAEW